MQRAQQIHTWLSQIFGDKNFEINYLAGDASFRRYARIQQQNKKYMLMDAPPEKENCQPFVQIAAFLQQHGTRVPHIVAQDLTQGFLLLEDFGDVVLSNVLNAQSVDQFYTQAFKQIIQLQVIAPDAEIFPDYSPEKLTQEMRLFDQWLLPALNISLSTQQQDLLTQSYDWILQNLAQQPQVIVHRDYHSRNLMLLEHEQNLGVIDFQDAVIGPDSYDFISIVRDAYIQWPKHAVQQWIEQFYAMLPASAKHHRDLAQFQLDVDVMSIQRHLKILGIFVRLYVRDGKSGYLKDLPRVMWYLRDELQHCESLQPLYQFIEQHVVHAFTTKYGSYKEVVA
ncbi:phosphotransferase [Acinetobacter qingfengensis]|uniref:Phosphotransferase n=1 Tax=Acinetobacter qingfengensis TaxID=1262585 RepID=A0A1E7RET6_9GAMM|nr:phosphotransferase [Acinetobacter qingfengensis]KAA8735645.1 phosphotransferase [Acinetobacter qingfengensis]OEY97909.1 phosphotransferase [Acinetobacter qingfengensis]